jgi:hypothetical protein
MRQGSLLDDCQTMSTQTDPNQEANFDGESVALLRHLKAKGLVVIVFSSERNGKAESGISVQFEKDSAEVMKDVPVVLRRMANRMERDLVFSKLKKG